LRGRAARTRLRHLLGSQNLLASVLDGPSYVGASGSASSLLLGEGLVFAGGAGGASSYFAAVAVSLHILVEPLVHLVLKLACSLSIGGIGG